MDDTYHECALGCGEKMALLQDFVGEVFDEHCFFPGLESF